MKLTGLLKDKFEEAQTKEEKKAIIAEAGIELTDEELDSIAGGTEEQNWYWNGNERRPITPKPVRRSKE